MPRSRIVRLISTGLALSVAIAGALTAAPPADEGLFIQTSSTSREIPERIAEKSFRARAVGVDLSQLADALEPAGELRLNLFPDIERTAIADRVQMTGPDSFTWKGSFQNDPSSSIVLVVSEGVVAGGITVDGRRFQIDPGRDDRQYLYEVDLERLPLDDADAVLPSSEAMIASARSSTQSIGTRSAAESTLDLAVFFTKRAKKAAGSKRALKALVKLGVAETNVALEDSKVEARFILKKLRKIPYPGTADIATDLVRLQSRSDGYLDKAHAIRDSARADVVLLVVDGRDPNRCGRAYLSLKASRPADWAFGVIRYDCISPNYSFGHELGHIMGLEHAPSGGTAVRPHLPYGCGFNEPDGLFRTMMAIYQPRLGPRVLHYSNPSVREQGSPTGVAYPRPGAADSARAINEVRELLASFR